MRKVVEKKKKKKKVTYRATLRELKIIIKTLILLCKEKLLEKSSFP